MADRSQWKLCCISSVEGQDDQLRNSNNEPRCYQIRFVSQIVLFYKLGSANQIKVLVNFYYLILHGIFFNVLDYPSQSEAPLAIVLCPSWSVVQNAADVFTRIGNGKLAHFHYKDKCWLTLHRSGGSAGLVVISGERCTEACGFESQHHILDGDFHKYFCKIVMFVWKDKHIRKEARRAHFRKNSWLW